MVPQFMGKVTVTVNFTFMWLDVFVCSGVQFAEQPSGVVFFIGFWQPWVPHATP